MSKKIGVEIVCPDCQKMFETEVFRSLWIEVPENLKLVLEDKVNVVKCPHCNFETKLKIPLLCTNVKKRFAIWYEPYHDEAIDKDVEGYREMLGAANFYSDAPRISDWNSFKAKIVEFENQKNISSREDSSDDVVEAISVSTKHVNKYAVINPFNYPKPFGFMTDHKKRLAYSFIPFSLLFISVVVKWGPAHALSSAIDDFDEFIAAFLIYTLGTFSILTLIHYGLREIIPNWKTRKDIRLWSFCSGCWVIASHLYFFMYEYYGEKMYADEWMHLWSVTFIPPLFIGIGGYVYEKHIK